VPRSSFPRRLLRAARLDAHLYEEVEADRSALGQALAVVLVASLSAALGRAAQATLLAAGPAEDVWVDLVLDVVEPAVLWLGGSAFVYMIGATFFRGPHTHTDYAEVLRTLGFAFTPALLGGLEFVLPGSAGLALGLALALWVGVAGVVAVRSALDFTTARALGTFGGAYLLLVLVLRGLA
jgi:hypothetical protein